ncbi:hypothetical protein BS17DRAFT_295188 [Gyrodon lividus]|nr:hypothetical protein BS17DRAFT_295188 [Gyrodon lividus]
MHHFRMLCEVKDPPRKVAMASVHGEAPSDLCLQCQSLHLLNPIILVSMSLPPRQARQNLKSLLHP